MKLLKVLISVLRRLYVRRVIYLDKRLLLGKNAGKLLTTKDTVIFLFQHLGFLINLANSKFISTQKTERFGLNSRFDSLNNVAYSPVRSCSLKLD